MIIFQYNLIFILLIDIILCIILDFLGSTKYNYSLGLEPQ